MHNRWLFVLDCILVVCGLAAGTWLAVMVIGMDRDTVRQYAHDFGRLLAAATLGRMLP